MKERCRQFPDFPVRMISVNTAVVGSGAAGYSAAEHLYRLGQRDILMISESRTAGTSRNTGSDKQTYYKLTLSGDSPDSVSEMAETLFSGRCVDGDLALCEAALSVRCFFRLVELGVPFPCNRYGEYVGYKTDHDPRQRATSIGPYTSRKMTEVLENSVKEKQIPFLDHTQVIAILRDEGNVRGLLCLNTCTTGLQDRYCVVCCRNVIYATGGPAGMYADSAYPPSQFGASGIAFEAGAHGRNLTEWQYGMASLRPRWNVSGSYMQVLPQFISTDQDGNHPVEFLTDFFSKPEEMLSTVFLKGYQWPFDVRKAIGGSSLIDLLVYRERAAGRRVFLDYRSNPAEGHFRFEDLSEEAFQYLNKCGCCFGTPYERLCHMNMPAVEFYREHGVDLAREPLEIAICAQHNNGGLAVDAWWQTDLPGFFAVGEAAGTHGVYRPGGAALNAGQVGSLRAAQYIAAHRTEPAEPGTAFEALVQKTLLPLHHLAESALAHREAPSASSRYHGAAVRMSACAAAFRNPEAIASCIEAVGKELSTLPDSVSAEESGLLWVFRLRDLLLCQNVYLQAYLDYCSSDHRSRGSALYSDPKGSLPHPALPESFRFSLEDEDPSRNLIQETVYENGECRFFWRPPHPVPEEDDFFENVWRSYRENRNII
jgi:succinate dehydrogenase/fumarate reductase flavoprotein subunit